MQDLTRQDVIEILMRGAKTIQHGEGAESVSSQLTDYLRRLIFSEELPAGTILPNEIEMCHLLGVGRSSMREAYKVLSTTGILKRSKRGTIVNNAWNFSHLTSEELAQMFSGQREMLDFRICIESEMVRLATLNGTDSEMRALRELVDQMAANRDKLGWLSYLDYQIHMQIAAMSHNPFFISTMEHFSNVFFEGIRKNDYVVAQKEAEAAVFYHQKLQCAMEERNERLASQRMVESMEAVWTLGQDAVQQQP